MYAFSGTVPLFLVIVNHIFDVGLNHSELPPSNDSVMSIHDKTKGSTILIELII